MHNTNAATVFSLTISDLQLMYNDLFKLFDNDMESMKSTIKSTTSPQPEQNERKRRFRKALSMRQSSLDMKYPLHSPSSSIDTSMCSLFREVNQRFVRLESSIVTLAESIAKLSAQVQMQRGIKDDVAHLREEIAKLRQQIPVQPSRLLSANVQRLAAMNTANPINTSTSTSQRSNAILDPRQARKIEQ